MEYFGQSNTNKSELIKGIQHEISTKFSITDT